MITVYCDGGSRGNPGPAAAGVAARNEKLELVFEISKFIGTATNNVAEYTALVLALDHLIQLKQTDTKIMIKMDSELVVRQMQGRYRVNNEGLKPLYARAREMYAKFSDIEIMHVRREFNTEADALANKALDHHKDISEVYRTINGSTGRMVAFQTVVRPDGSAISVGDEDFPRQILDELNRLYKNQRKR